VGPKKHVLDGCAHWRNLANTIEPSMCGGDAAFLSNYFDHLLCILTQVYKLYINIFPCKVVQRNWRGLFSVPSVCPQPGSSVIKLQTNLRKILWKVCVLSAGNDLTVGMICSRVYEIEGKQFEGGVVPWPVCQVSDCYNAPLFCVIGTLQDCHFTPDADSDVAMTTR